MKILVLSDSHGNTANCIDAVTRTMPDRIIHLGDLVRDAQALVERFPDIPLSSVPGNCDLFASNEPERLLEIEDKRIFFCHGHTRRVKSGILSFLSAAKEHGADAALFGHTHRVFAQTHEGVALLNPGSIGDPRYPTYGILEIVNGDILVGTVPLNGYPQ